MSGLDRTLSAHGEAFLQGFEGIRQVLSLYPPNHPSVIEQAERLDDCLKKLRAETGGAVFQVDAGCISINGTPLPALSATHLRSLSAWNRMGLGQVEFGAATTADSVLRFLEVLREPGPAAEARDLSAALERAGAAGIRLLPSAPGSATTPVTTRPPLVRVAPTDVTEARSRLRDSVGELRALIAAARATAGQPGRMVRSLCQVIESRLLERAPVRDLANQLEEHDLGWYHHAVGGATLAVLMGDALGLEREVLIRLGEAALLRDVGVLDTSREALRASRTAPGSGDEIRRHPIRGARRLLGTPEIDATAAIVALEHHAGFDGRGYPRLRATKGTHPFSRIVAVASDYDAATSGEVSEDAIAPADAVRDLVQAAGAGHDRWAVRALLRVVGFLPEGTAVTLRDGSHGLVAGIGHRSWLAPRVALLADARGKAIEPRFVETDALAPPGEAVVVRAGRATGADLERLAALRDAS